MMPVSITYLNQVNMATAWRRVGGLAMQISGVHVIVVVDIVVPIFGVGGDHGGSPTHTKVANAKQTRRRQW